MEEIKLELAKIVGTPSANSWSQVHTYFPDDPEKNSLRGKLLAVVNLESVEPGVEAVALGREILSRFHEEYYGNLEGGILERLQKSLEKIRTERPTTEITAGVIFTAKKSTLFYLGILGKGKAVVKRDSLLNEVLAGESEEGIEVGSGLVEIGDVILLGSRSFFEIVSEGALKAALSLGNPQEMIEAIAPMVLGRSEMVQAAAVICTLLPIEPDDQIAGLPMGETKKGALPTEPLSKKTPVLENRLQVGEEEPLPKEEQRQFLGKYLLQMFWQKIVGLKTRVKLPRVEKRPFYVRQARTGDNKSKVASSVALVLILLFLGSLILGVYQKKLVAKEGRAASLLTQAEEKYNQAKELLDLDSDTARKDLDEAKVLLLEAEKLGSKRTEEIRFLKGEIERLLSQSKKDYEVNEFSLFFDLGLIRSGARATDLALFENQLAILDQGNKAVYLIDLEKKSSNIFLNDSLGTGEKIAFSDQRIFVSTKEGILELSVSGKKFSLVVPKNDLWGKIVALRNFSGNLYLLDAEKKTIWQYPATDSGFGSIKSWLVSGTEIDFEPTAMEIDGSIWVSGSGGQLYKFTRGRKENFGIKGLTKPPLSINGFYLDEISDQVFLLDPESKNLFVLAKDGQFKLQYFWTSSPDQPESVFIWEKKAFLVKGNSIFTFLLNEDR